MTIENFVGVVIRPRYTADQAGKQIAIKTWLQDESKKITVASFEKLRNEYVSQDLEIINGEEGVCIILHAYLFSTKGAFLTARKLADNIRKHLQIPVIVQ